MSVDLPASKEILFLILIFSVGTDTEVSEIKVFVKKIVYSFHSLIRNPVEYFLYLFIHLSFI